ncbi:MAG: protein-methionine-sulfoxide reductase heme-binding subunit MsrQ [Chloroflexota bacterium]
MKTLFTRYTPLQIVMHIGAWYPLARLIFDFFAGSLSPNFIQDLELRTGRVAVVLLLLSLACTPLNTIFGWRELLKRRRALGLYAFMYATIHMLIFVELDYGLAWSLVAQNIIQKPRLIVGIIAFLMMVPLAITSFDIWKVRLGKNWKRLHQIIYVIGPLAILHYAWSRKGDIFALQGDIVQPLIYGLILAVLLILRIPPIRRGIASLRNRGWRALPKQDSQPGKTSSTISLD